MSIADLTGLLRRANASEQANRLLLLAAFQVLPHTTQQHSEFDRDGGCHKSDKHFKHDANHLVLSIF
jgi:hypothetical protein